LAWAKPVLAGEEDGDQSRSREGIATRIRHAVWQRDGAKCTECGAREYLEFDHIIPVAIGGSSTERNLTLLCEACNRRKGKSLG
jgi:5-methylcytosine-specific restriction endonuclease McrA